VGSVAQERVRGEARRKPPTMTAFRQRRFWRGLIERGFVVVVVVVVIVIGRTVSSPSSRRAVF